MSDAAREHWFDRLAVRQSTRRQVLKTLAAGAALTLPFGRAGSAAAGPRSVAGPHDCKKGCFYTTHRSFEAAVDRCQSKGNTFTEAGLVATLFVLLPPAVALEGIGLAVLTSCVEHARLAEKAAQYDCLQPNCPGFDPKSEFGPCANCATTKGCLCCPDPATISGYISCDGNVGYCCNPGGGCKSC